MRHSVIAFVMLAIFAGMTAVFLLVAGVSWPCEQYEACHRQSANWLQLMSGAGLISATVGLIMGAVRLSKDR